MTAKIRLGHARAGNASKRMRMRCKDLQYFMARTLVRFCCIDLQDSIRKKLFQSTTSTKIFAGLALYVVS